MNIKIAFCDDELSILNDLTLLLDRYRADRDCCEIEYSAYHSPLELIAGIEKGLRWDILILDIIMPGENGMELAKEIRQYDDNVKIIFLTSSPEFAVQSYTVEAFFYQLKPVCEETFFSLMDRVIKKCENAKSTNFVLKCKTGITAINPLRIEYCEVIGHSLLIHMNNDQVVECVGKLNDLENNLKSVGGFLRVHRSYLVNMAYIQSISYREVILSGTAAAKIPIPHGKYNEIKEIYLAYAFEKDRVWL